jgi:hypothetical protein
MRGGAISILAWATILLVLFIGNAVWDARAVNAAAAASAAFITYVTAIGLWIARRESIRRGPPEPRTTSQTIPNASVAAVGIGLSIGCILFGVAWANFLVYFGGGLLLASLGRLVLELRSERTTRRELSSKEPRR